MATSSRPLRLQGKAIPGALDRHGRVPGFDQARLSAARIVCIGAGGLIGHIAPTLARKGVGTIVLLDDDEVEASNLNRQRFYAADIGRNKARALASHIRRECTHATTLRAYPLRLEEALEAGMDLTAEILVVGVDNTPTRVLASREGRRRGVPVITCAVSAQADHGYVFVQEPGGPCLGCLFPDVWSDTRYPCPGTPAVVDILQAVGALTVYAIDTLLMDRPRAWTYRRLHLVDGAWDASLQVTRRADCGVCGR